MNIDECMDLWLAHRAKMVALDLVAQSTHNNQTQIVGTLKHHFGHLQLGTLRKSQAELFVGERLKFCEPVTVQGEMNVLRQFLNWCVDEEHLTAKPRLPTVKVPNVELPLPPDAAFLWVLTNAPKRHASAMEFMMLMGLAPHELERIQVRDALLTGDPVNFCAVDIGGRPDFKVKQASRKRWIPMNERARVIWHQMAAGLADEDQPFPSVEAMEKAIWRLRLANPRAPTGVGDITPKAMRKWFASKVANEQPEHVLQRLMGHAPGSKITRQHYVRSSDEQLVGAVGRLGK